MKTLRYERLLDITKTVKHYRGNKNRFPILYRNQSQKYFLVDKEGEDTIFRIILGTKWVSVDITEDEYLSLKDLEEFKHRLRDGGDGTYQKYIYVPREVGVVRPDNSFEFTADNYYQGDLMMMNNWCQGNLHRDSRRGGMVYQSYGAGLMHPIWKGMRVDCDTMESKIPYRVFGRRVSRKLAKTYLSKFSEFYKVAEPMVKAMDSKSVEMVAGDILLEYGWHNGRDRTWTMSSLVHEEMNKKAEEIAQSSPLDSLIMFGMAMGVHSLWRRAQLHIVNDGSSGWWGLSNDFDTTSFYTTVKSNINKAIYRQNKDVMKVVEYEAGKRFPASEWGTTVMVGDEEVGQY